jgi:hypothetical protein
VRADRSNTTMFIAQLALLAHGQAASLRLARYVR